MPWKSGMKSKRWYTCVQEEIRITLSCAQRLNCPRLPALIWVLLTLQRRCTWLCLHWPCLTPASFSVYTRLIKLYLGSCTLTSKGILLKLSMSGQGSPSDWLTPLLSPWSRMRRKKVCRGGWLTCLPASLPGVRNERFNETWTPVGRRKALLKDDLPYSRQRRPELSLQVHAGRDACPPWL